MHSGIGIRVNRRPGKSGCECGEIVKQSVREAGPELVAMISKRGQRLSHTRKCGGPSNLSFKRGTLEGTQADGSRRRLPLKRADCQTALIKGVIVRETRAQVLSGFRNKAAKVPHSRGLSFIEAGKGRPLTDL
jgi:hypothetical protein